MKKYLPLLIAFIMLALSLTASGQAFLLTGVNQQRETTPVPPAATFQRYIDDDDAGTGNNTVQFTGTWAHDNVGTKPSMYGTPPSYSYSQTTNSTVSAHCDDCFKWYIDTERYPWHGITEILIDNVVVDSIDQYALVEQPSHILWASDSAVTLTDGAHDIKLRVTGTANPLNVSGNKYLVIDAFVYDSHGSAPPPVDEDADWVVDDDGGGSDTGPCNSASPCVTINQAAQRALPGQTVVIRGGTYRETIVPLNSGTTGNDITYKAAAGETVIITGLNVLSPTWTLDGGNIYKTPASLPITGHSSNLTTNTTILANQIFRNGVMQFEASTRNITAVDDLFDKTKWKALTTANFTSTAATDAIFNGKTLTGATAVIQGWFAVGSRNVLSNPTNQVTYSGYSDNSSSGNQWRRWIYVSNDKDLLDQAMEWHYDGTNLFFWQSGGGSITGTIEYKARNWGFDLRSKSNIIIDHLQFKGCEPVTGNDATNYITVDNIRSTYANHSVAHGVERWQGVGMTRQMGLKLTGTNNILKNSEISYSSTQGVWIGKNGRVENNLIHHIGYDGGWGCGVDLWGEDNVDNIVVTYNTIHHTSRSSVSLGYCFTEFDNRRARNLDISYNDFSYFDLFSDDGGAIYTWGFRDHTGSVVHHNWFHDSGFVANPLNLPGTGVLDGIAVGFYTDQGAGPFVVHHNVFWNISENLNADASDFYTQPTFAGGGGGYRNNGGSKFYNNTFDSNAPWTGKSNPYNSPPEPFRNNIIAKTITYYPSGSAELGSENSNTYNGSPAPLFTGGSLSTPQIYFMPQAGSPAVNRGIVISGITGTVVGAPDAGAYERGVTAWVAGYVPVIP